MIFLSQRNLSPKTISRHLSSLRSFYKFLVFNDIIDKNPLEDISNPKIPKKTVKYLDENSLTYLLNLMEQDYEIRNHYLILEILYSTGLRVSELCNLKKSNIDFDNNFIRILGKGNKVRIIPITEKLKCIF